MTFRATIYLVLAVVPTASICRHSDDVLGSLMDVGFLFFIASILFEELNNKQKNVKDSK